MSEQISYSNPNVRLKLGTTLFPLKDKEGEILLQERGFNYRKAREILSALKKIGFYPENLRLVRGDGAEGSIPSGLKVLPKGGRSEVIELYPPNSRLNLCPGPHHPSNTENPEEEDGTNTLLRIIREVTGQELPEGILVKIKGRGPKDFPDHYCGTRDLSNPQYYINQKSLRGFTGMDWRDTEHATRLAGWHKILNPQGQVKEYFYLPSRMLICAMPIKKIYPADKNNVALAKPNEWQEKLYLLIFAEIGGYCIDDILEIIRNDKEADLLEYAIAVLEQYGLKMDSNMNRDQKKSKLSQFLLEKCWADAQIEINHYYIGENRTTHNLTLGGEQDLDDCEPFTGKETDAEKKDRFLEHFTNKVTRIAETGLIRKEDLLPYINCTWLKEYQIEYLINHFTEVIIKLSEDVINDLNWFIDEIGKIIHPTIKSISMAYIDKKIKMYTDKNKTKRRRSDF